MNYSCWIVNISVLNQDTKIKKKWGKFLIKLIRMGMYRILIYMYVCVVVVVCERKRNKTQINLI